MGTAEMYVEYSYNVKNQYAKGCTLLIIGSWFIL